MVDTEFSILDSLFYPWMKDINSPWWYKPDAAYTEWATPYPMATLEVQRPRMRYRDMPSSQESRNDAEYQYYSYKYIGVKPTNYNAFEVNGSGVSNLLRSLSLTCDMCLVDIMGDVAGSSSGSANLGNRRSFVFTTPPSASGSQDNQDENPDQDDTGPTEEEMEQMQEALQEMRDEAYQNEQDAQQQGEGDMPGEDEPEWQNKDDPNYNPDEYADQNGDGETQTSNMDVNEEGNPPDQGE